LNVALFFLILFEFFTFINYLSAMGITYFCCGKCGEMSSDLADRATCNGCEATYCDSCVDSRTKDLVWTEHKEILMQQAFLAGKKPEKVKLTKEEEWVALGGEEWQSLADFKQGINGYKTKCRCCTGVPSLHIVTEDEILERALLKAGTTRSRIKAELKEEVLSRLVAKKPKPSSD